jgi:hypothetical protein
VVLNVGASRARPGSAAATPTTTASGGTVPVMESPTWSRASTATPPPREPAEGNASSHPGSHPSASPSAPAVAPSALPPVAAGEAAPSGTGALTIICTPKCDSIVDNNVPFSSTNVMAAAASAGPHKLVLSAPNGVKKTVQVNIVAGQTREVRVSMDRNGPRDYGF